MTQGGAPSEAGISSPVTSCILGQPHLTSQRSRFDVTPQNFPGFLGPRGHFLLAAFPHSWRGWPPAPAGGRVEDEGGRVAGLGRKSISLLNHLLTLRSGFTGCPAASESNEECSTGQLNCVPGGRPGRPSS